MPGSKRSYSKRNFRSKRRYSKRRSAPSNKSLNKKIKHIERDLIELKWNDVGIETISTQVGPSLNDGPILIGGNVEISQGDQPTDRNGNTIYLTSYQLRMCYFTPVGQRSPCYIRVIVFWDRQSNGLAPVPSTGESVTNALLDTTSALNGPVPLYIAPYNYRTKDRYTVLYDKTYSTEPTVLNQWTNHASGTPNTQDSVLNSALHKNIFLKLGRRVKYAGSDNEVPITNSLYTLFMSSAENDTEGPWLSGCSRVYYKDA